ncbi:hypothetical protein SKAU_G00009690 [Synaphobranchus kaupii]|uniref:Uncharacterized protein n=1 Tax=Synaphobranchus kaupii TaxID=118154 RepID=A0A9Q1G9T2_SYNKA|nr:hypothetical protein SKAU_G00009690 [Synaphobranchus kaupii]
MTEAAWDNLACRTENRCRNLNSQSCVKAPLAYGFQSRAAKPDEAPRGDVELCLPLRFCSPVSQMGPFKQGFQVAAVPSRERRKNGTLKPQGRKEKWENQAVKRRRGEVENGVLMADPPENGFNDSGANMEREQDRGKDRSKKKTYSKKNKQGLTTNKSRALWEMVSRHLLPKMLILASVATLNRESHL